MSVRRNDRSTMIRTCLFDLGNVLMLFSHDRMCAQLASICRTEPEVIRRTLFDDGLLVACERGHVTPDTFHAEVQRRLEITVAPLEFHRAGSDIFAVNPRMPEILDAIKSRGIRLVLMSNTSEPHIDFIRAEFDILERFDHLVLSYEVRAMKPEPAIFEAALGAISCRPEECFYTDDIASYVSAARSHGIDGEVFVGAGALLSQLAARGLELPQGL